jgi:hypothetical protein
MYFIPCYPVYVNMTCYLRERCRSVLRDQLNTQHVSISVVVLSLIERCRSKLFNPINYFPYFVLPL